MAKGLLEEGLIEALIARDSSVFDAMLVVAMGMMGGEPKLGRLRLTCIGGGVELWEVEEARELGKQGVR